MRKLFTAPIFTALTAILTSSKEVKQEKLLETTTSWDGKTLPMYPTTQPKVAIFKITIPPKTRLAEHCHSRLNFAVVIEGTLKIVKANGETVIFKRGQAIAEIVGDCHYGVNEGSKPAVLYAVCLGEEGSPIFIEK